MTVRITRQQAPVRYEIPKEVVAEAVVNAVAHRDYTSNGSVQMMLFSDRLEVGNPGTLPPSLTLEKLREAHGSVPGNPLLAEPVYLASSIERMGAGTSDRIRYSTEASLPELEFAVSTMVIYGTQDDNPGSGGNCGCRPGPRATDPHVPDRIGYDICSSPRLISRCWSTTPYLSWGGSSWPKTPMNSGRMPAVSGKRENVILILDQDRNSYLSEGKTRALMRTG